MQNDTHDKQNHSRKFQSGSRELTGHEQLAITELLLKRKLLLWHLRLNKMISCEPCTPNINTIYRVLSVTIKLLKVFEGTSDFPKIKGSGFQQLGDTDKTLLLFRTENSSHLYVPVQSEIPVSDMMFIGSKHNAD